MSQLRARARRAPPRAVAPGLARRSSRRAPPDARVVFRCVLDGTPRMLVVALGDGPVGRVGHAALRHATKAWKGGVKLRRRRLHDRARAAADEPRRTTYIERLRGRRVVGDVRNGKPSPRRARFGGYTLHGARGPVELHWRPRLPDGATVARRGVTGAAARTDRGRTSDPGLQPQRSRSRRLPPETRRSR